MLFNWSRSKKVLKFKNKEKTRKILKQQKIDCSWVKGRLDPLSFLYCKKGDLDAEICNGIKGNIRAVSVARDILSGLSHLHAENLLHRDLKAQNILISDDSKAIIGDFGSVKMIPEGDSTVPGSGHSLNYTPPESISSGMFGVPGDLYQVGVVFFQILGGKFPYEESAWLNKFDLKKYRKMPDEIDRQLFAAECIKKKICRGQIVDTSTLPPWVCMPLRRTSSKACNVQPPKRYQSCSEFLSRLNSIRGQIHDWKIIDGYPLRQGDCKYRILFDNKKLQYYVQKDKGSGWRKDNSFKDLPLREIVSGIEKHR